MNSVLAEFAEMPPSVVTVTLIFPLEAAGEIAVISVDDTTMNEVAAALPKFTEVAVVRLVPVIVTCVPPVVKPVVGEIEAMTGMEM